MHTAVEEHTAKGFKPTPLPDVPLQCWISAVRRQGSSLSIDVYLGRFIANIEAQEVSPGQWKIQTGNVAIDLDLPEEDALRFELMQWLDQGGI